MHARTSFNDEWKRKSDSALLVPSDPQWGLHSFQYESPVIVYNTLR